MARSDPKPKPGQSSKLSPAFLANMGEQDSLEYNMQANFTRIAGLV
jgi:hypothetical protein